MKKYRILYNPFAGNKRGKAEAEKLCDILADAELTFTDMTSIEDYSVFFEDLSQDETLIIAGGDGTLNRFVNDTANIEVLPPVFYFATGSGNDFLSDIGMKKGADPVCIDDYIRDLPTVEVEGKNYKFINGIGYGIDGYCCEEGDRQRAASDKPVNYTSIAIKGLLFHFKPKNAKITVDGKVHSYEKVWLAPTMNGRFYGGGMIPTPAQDRLSKDNTLSVMVYHGFGKLKTLAVFPSIFKGEHVKHTEMVEVLVGHDIEVEFDTPCALQIDGETILGVSGYKVSGAPVTKAEATEEREPALV